MTTVVLARRGTAQPQQQAPRIKIRSRALSKDARRETILRYAMDVAKQRDGLVAVQAVVDELAAKGVNLGMDKPNTSVGNMLYQSDEFKREGTALFRYVGKQLDLGRAK